MEPSRGAGLKLGLRSVQRQLSYTPVAPSSPRLVRVPSSVDDPSREEEADAVVASSPAGGASYSGGGQPHAAEALRTAEAVLPESPLVAKILLTDTVTLMFYNTDTADRFKREWDLEEMRALDQTFDSQLSFFTFLQESLHVAKASELPTPEPGSISCGITLSPDARKVGLTSVVQPRFSFIRPLHVVLDVWRIQEGSDSQRHHILMGQLSSAFKELNRENVEDSNQALVEMGCKLEAGLSTDVLHSVREMRRGLGRQLADLKSSMGRRVVLGDDNLIVSDRLLVTSLTLCRPGQARRLSTTNHVRFAVSSQSHADQIAVFTWLTILNLRGCESLTRLDFLRSLSRLRDLNIACCKRIADLQPIAGLQVLEAVDLTDCQAVEDASPLYRLSMLKTAIVTGTKLNPQTVALSLRSLVEPTAEAGVDPEDEQTTTRNFCTKRRLSDAIDEDLTAGNVKDMPPAGTGINAWIGWRPLEIVTRQLMGQTIL